MVQLKNKHIIIYSHGFGVLEDDCGIFTDIAKALLVRKLKNLLD